MPAKKRARKHKKINLRQQLPLLAIGAGVTFFVLQLLFMLYMYNPAGELVGIMMALWMVGGVVFAAGVAGTIRESRWAILLLSAPALSFGIFCALSMLSGVGHSLIDIMLQT